MPEVLSTTTEPDSETAHGLATSLLFWLCLLIAATMYAGVALSPKLLAWATLKQDEYRAQVRLVALERQVTYLGRVVDALENDPEFAAQLARVDFDATRPGDERISVDPSLSLDARDATPSIDSTPRHVSMLVPLLKELTERSELRRALLTASAALMIFAFTFLNEPTAPTEKEAQAESDSPGKPLQDFFARRYRVAAPAKSDRKTA